MAHELDFSTGDAAFVQVGERVDAWHKHGRSLTRETLAAAGDVRAQSNLILAEARLGWTVDPFDVRDETNETLAGWKAFKRSDTGNLFGVFPESYTILQNHEMFELLEPLVEAGMLQFETAGAIYEGRDVWALFNFNAQDEAVNEFFGAEGIKPYLLVHNNHDRKRMLSFRETTVKVVCKNTLAAATGTFSGKKRAAGRYPGAVLLRHTRNVKSLSVDAIDDLWGNMTRRYSKVVESYAALKLRYITEAEFNVNVLDLLAPLPEDIENPRVEKAVERAFARRTLLLSLYAGAGLGIDGEPTAWNAYMAATEAVDHYRGEFAVKADEMAALFPGGTLANKKQDVLNALVGLTA
jgi:phage/plasmid-like protein (TIGR03299 family)